MKHNLKITFILLAMFLVTQFIGLYVVDHYLDQDNSLPYGLETPDIQQEKDFYDMFPSIIIAFIIAIVLLFLLTRFKAQFILKTWFFLVVLIALAISLNSMLPIFKYTAIMSLIIALPLALVKIYGKDFIVHNATELFIYPGVAAVFVPLLNIWTIIILLIIISLYDAWAVWHSGIMQKMAKYQIDKLKVFSGFFVPYASGKIKAKIKLLKKTAKGRKQLATKKIKVNLAILGGGDIVFPIITSGVMLKTFESIWPAIFVIIGATLGLSYLFFFAEKKKFYPAMPFISAGMFIGIGLSYLIF